MIQYEYPLNERVRTLLRLEDLFDKLDYFAVREHPLEHHVALVTMFEIIDVGARADLKSDLLQELERQKQTLLGFRDNPAVSREALNQVLAEIESTSLALNATSGKIGQHLREHEWLMSVRSRTIIPGGACEFDLPSYHSWQRRDAAERKHEIGQWTAPFAPMRNALKIVLRLLRESAQRAQFVAASGSYQQMLGGKQVQMLQVRVDEGIGAFPEISANKYMLWIRFMMQGPDLKPKAIENDVPFEMALCNL